MCQSFIFGTTGRIIIDADKTSKKYSLPIYLHYLGIEYHHITPDIYLCNGQVERYMRTYMNLIRVQTTGKPE